MPDPTDTITIENVVASTALDQELDLDQLTADPPSADYHPERFPGLIYRIEEPTATTLLFRSGNIVATGAQSTDAIHIALVHLFDALAELGLLVPDHPTITIQNIVSSADLTQPLNLHAIALAVGLERIEYEPEQFPGLVYRLDDPLVVVLLFGSGKLVITGGTTPTDAEDAIETLQARLAAFNLLD
ncbi:TATA-box-binding protein [Halomarina halobia]|uniref:TATA-box-binding protein n=1 Tax=Halomarina halobia TaxID=3033386 RepID=A0ABD6AGQ7_9EURY|nr:TATA-box-binding protein [Halomarina sp. PSR21]